MHSSERFSFNRFQHITSFQFCVLLCRSIFQFQLSAQMKPLFGPIWNEFLYEEARGVIMATLLY
jgi:hypothetical protein